MNREDPHHCHCFSIDESDIDEFRKQLEEIGFKNTFWQYDSEFEFGLVKRIDEYTQMHVKVNSDGKIEAEMEYPPDYPIAHMNQKHSYSAHYGLKEIFKVVRIKHKSKLFPPLTCLKPKIIPAISPSHAKTIVGGLVVVGIVGTLLYFLIKGNKEERN